MKQRNPWAVVGLSIITFGIYGIYWFVSTKNDMNKRGETIPTAWLIIIPFVNFYWYWKYAEGVEHVTSGKMSQIENFLLMVLIGIIGMPITQSAFNNVGASDTAVSPSNPNIPIPNETTMIPAQPADPATASITPQTPVPAPPSAPTPETVAPTTPQAPPESPVTVGNPGQPQDLNPDNPVPPAGPTPPPTNPPLVQ